MKKSIAPQSKAVPVKDVAAKVSRETQNESVTPRKAISTLGDSFSDRNRWMYDIQHRLENELDALKDDLRSYDPKISEIAAREAVEILAWMLPPNAPLTADEKINKVLRAISDEKTSGEEKVAISRRVMRSTGRPRGRPRTETAQHAISALTLHFSTSLSWREIALKVKGCNHKRPNLERSCSPCGDAIRDAVGRLEKFLKVRATIQIFRVR